MSFKDCLNQYLERLGCTARELSDASNVSPAVLSRYRSGERVPGSESAQLSALAKGVAVLSGQKGPSLFSEEEVYLTMLQSITGIRVDYGAFMSNLHALLVALSIGNNELARALNLDPSYISRILSKKRRPADLPAFIAMISSYVARRYTRETDIRIVAELTDRNTDEFRLGENYAAIISDWLGTSTRMRANNVSKFLESLDRYNVAQIYKAGKMLREEGAASDAYPVQKMYRGWQGMREAEIDFLKIAAAQKSPGKTVVYSDWPMEDAEKDSALNDIRLQAIRTIVSKGGELYVIHNVHRPFREMMESLEYWIPFYLTGKVFPYYLKMPQGDPFIRAIGYCGQVAFAGTAITGHEKEGRIRLSRDPEEVAYCRQELSWLLKKAYPLMEIFVKGNELSCKGGWKEAIGLPGKRTVNMCTLPIFTISDELLTSMMDRLGVQEEERKAVFEYVRFIRENVSASIDRSVFQITVPDPDKDAFSRGNYTLSLSGLFPDKEYPYTYEEYQEHLRLTEEDEKKNRGLIISKVSTPAYRHLNIILHEEHCLMITRNHPPVANIFMKFPGILQAFENFALKIERSQ